MADIRIIPSTGLVNVTGSIDFRGTGGSTMLFMTGSSGNVGIGTTSSTYKLSVHENVNSGLLVTFRNPNTGTGQYTEFKLGQADASEIRIGSAYNYASAEWNQSWIYAVNRNLALKTPSGYHIRFYAGGTTDEYERMRVDSGGNIGIGTTSPAGKLSISTPNAYDGTILQLQSRDEPTAYNLKINEVVTSGVVRWSFDMTNSSAYNNVLVFDRGNIGIGVTTPSQKLEVTGNIYATGYVQGSTAYMSDQSGVSSFGSNSSTRSIRVGRDGTANDIFITGSSGHVGIGTNSPYAPLHIRVTGTPPTSGQQGFFGSVVINGDANQWNRLRFDTATTGSWGVAVNPDRKFVISRLDSSFSGYPDDSNFVIDTSGKVGIGLTNPNTKLHILGPSLTVTDESTYGLWVSETGDDTKALILGYDQGIDAGIITAVDKAVAWKNLILQPNVGGVGIGTTSPSYKLDVAGTGYFSGLLTANANLYISNNGGNIYFDRPNGATVGAIGWHSDDFFYVAGHPSYGPTAGNDVRVYGFGATLHLGNSTAGDVLSIGTAGNVGIGTNVPTNKLQVAGGVTATSFVGPLTGNAATATSASFASTAPYSGLTGTVPTWNQNTTGNAASATVLQTARTFTIGSTGKTFNGSANVSWTLGEIGAQATLTNPVTGTGTTNFVTKFTGTSTVGNSSIFDNGNVGIGTTSPAAKLYVTGSADVFIAKGSGSTTNTTIMAIDGNNGRLFEISDDLSDSLFSVNTIAGLPVIEAFADYTVTMGSYNKSDLVVTGSKVGIGTPNPQRKLDVYDSGSQIVAQFSSSNASSVRIRFSDANTASENVNIGAIGTRMALWTNNTERLSILSGGNVGIGTTAPTALFEVASSGATFASIKAGSQTEAYLQLVTPSSGIGYIIKNATTGNSALNKSLYLWNGDGPIQFVPNGTIGNAVSITTDGNLGIGTNAPSNKIQVVGGVTATSFVGALTGNASTATSASFASTAPYSGLTGTVPTWNQNTTGNAASATVLQTARTIGGVSFDGSANINLPGVNTAGNQNTSGFVNGTSGQLVAKDDRIIEPNSITSNTLQFGFTSYANNNGAPYGDYLHLRSYGDSSGGADNLVMFLKSGIGMRIYQQTWNSGTAYSSYKDIAFTDSSITGNAASATILQTARTIGGVSFDGSANINLPGVNTAGNQNTTGNASTATTASFASTAPYSGLTGTVPTWNQNTTGNAGSVTNGVYTTGAQTIDGVKTFSELVATNPMINSAGTSNDNSVMQWRYGTSDAYRLRLKQTVTSGVVRWNFSQTNNNTDFNDVLVLDRGNVGIGTTAPATKLHVNGGGRFEGSVALGYGSAGEYSLEMGLGRTGNGFAYIDLIGDATYTDYGIRIIRGNGGADTTSTIETRGTGEFKFLTNEAAPIVFLTTGTERMRILSGGNVGIGETNPAYKLGVVTSGLLGFRLQTSNSTVGNPAIDLYDAGRTQETVISSTDGTTVGTYIAAYSNHPLLFGTNAGASPTAKMVINTGGNVGIGSASPGWKLDVVGNARIGDNTAQLKHAALQVSSGQGSAITYRDIDLKGSWAANEGHAITATHGTTSTNIVGQIVFEHNSPGSRIKFGALYDSGDQSSYPMNLVSNGSSGNLGINTTAPGADLHIDSGNSGAATYALRTDTVSLDYALYVSSSGNVAIGGLVPAAALNHKLTVFSGSIALRGPNNSNFSYRLNDTSGVNRNALYVSSSNYLNVGNAAFAGLELFHTGSAPGSNNIDSGASRYYGTDQTYYLAEPNKWLAVRINNVNYVMPMYEV